MLIQSKYKPSILLAFTAILVSILISGFASHEATAQVPENPVMDSVSIVDNLHPIIAWIPNTENTTGYSIYRGRIDGFTGYLIFDSLTSIQNANASSYIDDQVSGCTEQRLYKVRAFNAEEASNWLVADTMNTILITQLDFDICSNSNTLQWIPYQNMRNQLGGYQILASANGSPFVEAGRVSAIRNYFTHTPLAPGTTYTYKIRAFNEDESRTSTSCERSFTTSTYHKPAFSDLRMVTVESNENIGLVWNADAAPISKFEILRADNGSNFTVIAEIEDLNNFDPTQEYTDTTADVARQSYFYKIHVFDSCGQYLPLSDVSHRSILLRGDKTSETLIDLQWNTYEGWDEGVESYEVFREILGTNNPAASIAQLNADDTSHTDNISEITDGKGRFLYTIKAIEKGGNNTTSFSNTIIIEIETQIKIPNAISLSNGEPDFKPDPKFIDPGSYQFLIYNKWGQQIFESNSLDKGWDGTFEGDKVASDTYVYLIKFKNARGENIEKRGTVTVVR